MVYVIPLGGFVGLSTILEATRVVVVGRRREKTEGKKKRVK